MTEEKIEIPRGYLERADGALIPESKVAEIDKDRTRVVTELCELAKQQSLALADFKARATNAVLSFIARSLDEYDVVHGGKKGNVTLVTFDGRYKVVRQMQESIVFDERLQAAKLKIDECITSWSRTTNSNIKVLVNDAFQVDQAGKINTGRVLRLRNLKIDDPNWQIAMKAIADSMQVAGSKPYIRFYERTVDGDYVAISLDVATL